MPRPDNGLPTQTKILEALSEKLSKQELSEIAQLDYGLKLVDEVLSAALVKAGNNPQRGVELAADCLRGLGERKNLSFTQAKMEALRRLDDPKYLAQQQQARQISSVADKIPSENLDTRNYVEKRLGQELKGRSNLLNDSDTLNNQVIEPIRQRIAQVSRQTPDELSDELEILDRRLEPYEQQLRDLENRVRGGGELDALQQEKVDQLKNDIIPKLETEIDYLEKVRRSKLRPQFPQSPKPTANNLATSLASNTTPQQVFVLLTGGGDSSFEPFYRMLMREKFVSSPQEVIDEIAKLSFKGKTIDTVSRTLKRVYRPKVIERLANPDPQLMRQKYPKLASPNDPSLDLTSPAYIEARHKEFLGTIDGLNSGDIGSIGEAWFQRIDRVPGGSETQVPVTQSDMAKQGINLTQNRQLDEVYGDTIREIKTISGVLVDSQNSKEALQFKDYATLAEKGVKITVNKGQVSQIKKLVYVFPVPKGVKANANWMIANLRDRPYLFFYIFNTKGERKLVGLNNLNELQGKALSDWLKL